MEILDDDIANAIKIRNWYDWRNLRFNSLKSMKARAQIAEMAKHIKHQILMLNEILPSASAELENIEHSADQPLTADYDAKQFVEEILDPEYSPQSLNELPSPPEMMTFRDGKFIANDIDKHEYHVFTSHFDEIISPIDLMGSENVAKYISTLANHTKKLEKDAEHSINYLDTQLDSLSDNRKLLPVTILIDHSGSMRGIPIRMCATWSVVISRILSDHEIPHEILGFTTRAWKGGQSRELWISNGKPEHPGRLNDIRYIVYKTFDQGAQESFSNISFMLKEGLLKENIDGEALVWAHNRIRQHNTNTSSIFVFTDGAPVDDSTLASNEVSILHDHLIKMIDSLTNNLNTNLFGIGIDVEISRYYRDRSIKIDLKNYTPNDIGYFIANSIVSVAEQHSEGR